MQRKIQFVSRGRSEVRGEHSLRQLLPDRYVRSVGPFVFFEHLFTSWHSTDPTFRFKGNTSQPHRGLAKLTYVLNGDVEHFDSAGFYGRVNSGGVHWTKAGNGVLQDEIIHVDSETYAFFTHVIKCWINLPAREKVAVPDYCSVQADELLVHSFDFNYGWLKLIIGEFGDAKSGIPTYGEQFLFHIHLEREKGTTIYTNPEWNYAAVLLNNSTLNDVDYKEGDFLLFENGPGHISLAANLNDPVDIILFGGEPITESFIIHGPFVMTTKEEIARSYTDFHAGKYGPINYRSK